MASDDDFVETQWTPEARERYAAAAAELTEALAAHTGVVSARVGRQAEHAGYFSSAQRLEEALKALREAEFDLVGSFPFLLGEYEEDEMDDDLEDLEPGGPVLTVEVRAEFRITDEEGLLEEGRAAYLTAWENDTDEDARVRVSSPSSAVAEIIHGRNWDILRDGTPNLFLSGLEMAIEQGDQEPGSEVS